MNKWIVLLLSCCLAWGTLYAQEDAPSAPYGVWVTVQDYLVLRLGPGENWERLTVLPFGLTLPAVGRSADGEWVQVAYGGPLDAEASSQATRDGITYGWINRRFLVWTGAILGLPLDGQPTVPMARRSNPRYLARPGCCYEGEFIPTAPTDDIQQEVVVELIGQVGTVEKWYWMQFQLNGQTYWAPSIYGLGLPEPQEIGYNRLLSQSYATLSGLERRFYAIGERWWNLAEGRPTSCNAIPQSFAFKEDFFQAADLASEPTFRPTYEALIGARDAVNQAIADFQAQCDDPTRSVTPQAIDQALGALETARLQMDLLYTLQQPYRSNTPIYGD